MATRIISPLVILLRFYHYHHPTSINTLPVLLSYLPLPPSNLYNLFYYYPTSTITIPVFHTYLYPHHSSTTIQPLLLLPTPSLYRHYPTTTAPTLPLPPPPYHYRHHPTPTATILPPPPYLYHYYCHAFYRGFKF